MHLVFLNTLEHGCNIAALKSCLCRRKILSVISLWPVARLPAFLRLNSIPLPMRTAFCLFICRAHLGFYLSVTVNKAAVNMVHV